MPTFIIISPTAKKNRQTNNAGLAVAYFFSTLQLKQPKKPDLWSGDGGQGDE
jgi:hypothetical protein